MVKIAFTVAVKILSRDYHMLSNQTTTLFLKTHTLSLYNKTTLDDLYNILRSVLVPKFVCLKFGLYQLHIFTMDYARSAPMIGDDNNGLPDDLRCKRSDGKQWRCTAKSMPDKTVCEKHYVQAKKRAANSAMRASMKKAKRRSLGESDVYLESKSDDLDSPVYDLQLVDSPISVSGRNYNEKVPISRGSYSPETPSVKSLSVQYDHRHMDNDENDELNFENNYRSFKTPPLSALDMSMTRSQEDLDVSDATESSDGGGESSDGNGGQICHQCQRDDEDLVMWCLACDRRGYCGRCISTWYDDIPLDEIQTVCPACRGTCTCKICLRKDNLIKERIREIPVLDKLQYLHCILSSVLLVIKEIHHKQCLEVDLERKLQGNEIDLPRTKLNADEQMCCDCCRISIIDYHRHCTNCSYDLCLQCCQDLREASGLSLQGNSENHIAGTGVTAAGKVERSKYRLKLSDKFPNWKANSNSSIPCPPKEYGGCGCLSLTLKRIFKMNWVAKLVKNSEELVSACKLYEESNFKEIELNSRLNDLYCPTSEAIKAEGIGEFRKHWSCGEPVIVQDVFGGSSMASWDPVVIWKGVRETKEEKMKDGNRAVKAVDCLDWSEVYIELGQFIKGYSDGRVHKNGSPQMLKLKDWPSPSAAEEFLLYQRPDFIKRLPLLEFIHSRLGLLNVAAKLPHYSLQNDAGPRIFISYGMHNELGRGDSVENLHCNTRDMVYLLVHTSEVRQKDRKMTNIEEKETNSENLEGIDQIITLGEDTQKEYEAKLDGNKDTIMDGQVFENTANLEEKTLNFVELNMSNGDSVEKINAGTITDGQKSEDVVKKDEIIILGDDTQKEYEAQLHEDKDTKMDGQVSQITANLEEKTLDVAELNMLNEDSIEKVNPGTITDGQKSEDVDKKDEMISLGDDTQKEYEAQLDEDKDTVMDGQVSQNTANLEEKTLDVVELNMSNEDFVEKVNPGTITDNQKSEDIERKGQISSVGEDAQKDYEAKVDEDKDTVMDSQVSQNPANLEEKNLDFVELDMSNGDPVEKVDPGSIKDDKKSEDVEGNSPISSLREEAQKEYEAKVDEDEDTVKDSQVSQNTANLEEKTLNAVELNISNGDSVEKVNPGTIWDVFRRQDVPKLIEYVKVNEEFGKNRSLNDCETRFLYDAKVYLNEHHKRKLKDDFGVEPWTFEQHLGQAVFIPAGCPFQVRNLQSTVQLGHAFLSPESVYEAARLADELRSLPNEHDAKLQMLEVRQREIFENHSVGKISLYAASSAIREVQKLVLDPKLGVLGYEDPNLTAKVSENIKKMVKRRHVSTCA